MTYGQYAHAAALATRAPRPARPVLYPYDAHVQAWHDQKEKDR